MKPVTRLPDVFSPAELARVTGLPVRQIRALIQTAAIPTVDGALVARHDAFRACRALLDRRLTGRVTGRSDTAVALLAGATARDTGRRHRRGGRGVHAAVAEAVVGKSEKTRKT